MSEIISLTNDTLDPMLFLLDNYGVKEVRGHNDNAIILEMFDELNFGHHNLHDETSWCAAAMGWSLKKTGYAYLQTLSAAAYLDYGESVIKSPRIGDIAIFWRGKFKGEKIPGTNVMKAHIGYRIGYEPYWMKLLSGNVSDELNISKQPMRKLLDIRRPYK